MAYLSCPPEKICFRANRFGKPELAGEDSPSLHFSLSHSQSIAVWQWHRDNRLAWMWKM